MKSGEECEGKCVCEVVTGEGCSVRGEEREMCEGRGVSTGDKSSGERSTV